MVFSSFVFIFGFLPATLAIFWLVSRASTRWAKLWLCAASIIFYSWWHPAWTPILLLSIAGNYLVGWRLIRQASAERSTRLTLALGVLANLGVLFYYKYLFAILTFFNLDTSLSSHGALPLGISFFTFTQIAFLVDVSQGFSSRYTPTNYFLFVTFFPHLIAGPIVHHQDLMPQFEEEKNYRFRPDEFAVGLSIFSIGLAKKTMIADTMGAFSGRLLNAGHVDPKTAWLGVLAYSMQLYFDFSGYSDMAIGLARLFGIKFPVNFDSPYKATSIIEFWQRWHITLTRFLTAYTYNPVALMLVRRRAAAGLSTSKRASQTVQGFLELIALPTFITMLLAGIWHGAGVQFIIFGALHGAYITVNHGWRTFGPKTGPTSRLAKAGLTIVSGALVYACVLVAQIFFRAASATAALSVLSDLVGLDRTPVAALTAPSYETKELVFLTLAMAIAWLAPNTQQLMARHDPVLTLGRPIDGSPFKVSLNLRWAVAIGVVLFLGLINIRDGQPFIYFQF